MSFYQRYQLDRLIADGDAKTFRAKDTATGRAVLLHMFNPQGAAVLAVLKSKLAIDPARPSPPLLELGEFAGSPYAVTEEVQDFKDLRSWLGSLPNSLPARPPAPSGPSGSSGLRPASAPGSMTARFNQLFDAPGRSPSPPPQASSAQARPPQGPPQVPPPQAAIPQASAAEQGEFTRMFGTPSTPPAYPPAYPQSAPAQSPQPQSVHPQTESSEFTQWFKLPQEAVAPKRSAPPQTPPKSSNDDFDRMFGPTPTQGPPPYEQAAKPPGPKDDHHGQFTGLFGMGPVGESINIEAEQARAARSAPEARPFQAPSEFTRVFGPGEGAKGRDQGPGSRTVRSASGLFGDPKQMGRPRTESQTQSGPGDYTRIVAASQPGPNAPDPSPPVPAAPVKKTNWVLWLAIGFPVFLLIVFAIVAAIRSRN